jgi:hypothetical protein
VARESRAIISNFFTTRVGISPLNWPSVVSLDKVKSGAGLALSCALSTLSLHQHMNPFEGSAFVCGKSSEAVARPTRKKYLDNYI